MSEGPRPRVPFAQRKGTRCMGGFQTRPRSQGMPTPFAKRKGREQAQRRERGMPGVNDPAAASSP